MSVEFKCPVKDFFGGNCKGQLYEFKKCNYFQKITGPGENPEEIKIDPQYNECPNKSTIDRLYNLGKENRTNSDYENRSDTMISSPNK